MALLTDRNTFLLAVAVYGVSMIYSVFLWRRGFRRDEHVSYFLLLLAFGLHTTAMIQRGFSVNRCPVSNLFEATMFLEWAFVLAYLVVGLLPRLRFVGAIASPLLFIIGVFERFVPGPAGTLARELSILTHFERFSRGVIDTQDLLYFAGMTAMALALASYDSRRG